MLPQHGPSIDDTPDNPTTLKPSEIAIGDDCFGVGWWLGRVAIEGMPDQIWGWKIAEPADTVRSTTKPPSRNAGAGSE